MTLSRELNFSSKSNKIKLGWKIEEEKNVNK
jgi:hypothetical protein